MDFPAPEDHDYNESRPDDYDPIPLTERFTHPVCQSEFIAWKVLLAPDHHDGFYRSALIKRGMESYRGENGTLQEDAIINDAEEFALAAATTLDYSTVTDLSLIPTLPLRPTLSFSITCAPSPSQH